jgi:hypothetical protein
MIAFSVIIMHQCSQTAVIFVTARRSSMQARTNNSFLMWKGAGVVAIP